MMIDTVNKADKWAAMSVSERSNVEELKAEISRLKAYVKDLERAADTDPLIPVYNRRAFLRELSRAQSIFDRYNIMTSVLYFDLNDFKAVNDRYGHVVGDDLLISIGRTLQSHIRDCDLVARLGGDEFGVLLFKTDEVLGQDKAESLADLIKEASVKTPRGNISVSTSYGVALVKSGVSPERILSEADADMYRNKRSGSFTGTQAMMSGVN